jgi:hypothetical protein
MVEYTHRRYWVEQFHEEAKSLLGWDQLSSLRTSLTLFGAHFISLKSQDIANKVKPFWGEQIRV